MWRPSTVPVRSALTVALFALAFTSCGGRERSPSDSDALQSTKSAITSTPNALGPGQALNAGQTLVSINGQYTLTCQADGAVVIRQNPGSGVVWSSQSGGGATAANCSMQTDGNFVVYTATSTPIWYTGSSGNPGARLTLQNDGIAVIFKSDGGELWSSRTSLTTGVAPGGTRFEPNMWMESANGLYRLTMQGDGNLVVRRLDTFAPIWNSGTGHTPGAYAVMQTDGNFVVYPPSGAAVWNAGTAGNPGARLFLGPLGDLQVQRADGGVLWRSFSAQPRWRFIFGYAGNGTRGNTPNMDGAAPMTVSMNRPTAMTRTENGSMFILDAGNNKVVRINSDGAAAYYFDRPGTGIARSSPNLLLNPSGEEDTADWREADGTPTTWFKKSPFGGCTPPNCVPMSFDDQWSLGYGGGNADAENRQEVPLNFGSEIDQGLVELALTGYVRSANHTGPDQARVILEFLDANRTVNQVAYDSGYMASVTTWGRVYAKRTAPVGARYARVRLLAHKVSTADNANEAYFDGFSLIRIGSNGLNNPQGIVGADSASSPADSVIIADTYNHRIVKLAQAGGTLQVLAGNTGTPGNTTTTLNCPKGLAKASNGDIYIADSMNHRVMRLRNGAMTVIAGNGTEGWGGDDGPATSANLSYPSAVAVTANGDVYIADRGNAAIRKVSASTGIITRFAGSLGRAVGYSGDGGPATSALMGYIEGITAGTDDAIYVADPSFHVVRVIRQGTINAFAGLNVSNANFESIPANTGDGGGALGARFNMPRGLLVHPSGDLYITDQDNNRVRVVGCSNRDVCDGTETNGQSCSGGTALPVDDGNACTKDTCDPSTGAITHSSFSLDDGDPCTDDLCTPSQGIRHPTKAAGSACDDGDPCTSGDVCQSGAALCRGAPRLPPDDGNACTVGSCDPASGDLSHVPVAGGVACGTGKICDGAGTCEAPPPVLVIPPLDRTRATPFAEWVRFIYMGYNGSPPIQSGVSAGAVDDKRVALLSGRVVATTGSPVGNVRVTVPGTPGLGQTLTRVDGKFDIVVNGGGDVTLRVAKGGSLSADRTVSVQALQSKTLDDIVIKQLDAAVTSVSLGASSYQVAASTTSRDVDGDRQAVAMIAPGTQAVVRKPDGTTQPLNTMNLRMTEYTVGAQGPAAMPAPIPPTTAYTYAVEVSADEAIAAGADTVEFDRPVSFYVDNYLGFPVGEKVPSGYYDKDKKAWVPSDNGLVLGVVAVNNGVADVDATGDGQTSQAEMDAIGASVGAPLTLEERRRIGARYVPGKTFWRVPMKHLTPWDCNWPKGPPPCENDLCPGAMGNATATDKPICSSQGEGSIIECEAQGLGERVDVAGTPFTLNYRSSREPGYQGNRLIRLDLTGDRVHSQLKRIEVAVSVAGQRMFRSYGAATHLSSTIAWNGLDGFGRPVIGSELATVTLTAVFPAVYYSASQFGSFSVAPGTVIAANRDANEIRLSKEVKVELMGLPPRDGWSIGGWTFDVHHFLDVRTGQLFRGDGSVRKVDSGNHVVRTIAGNGTTNLGPDGSSALSTGFDTNNGNGRPGMAVAPNGDVYVADPGHRMVRRIEAATGKIFTVTGFFDSSYPCANGPTPTVADGPAASARFHSPSGVAFGKDGSLYITDMVTHSIRRLKDGQVTTIAGSTTCGATRMPSGFQGDGGPATQALLNAPQGIAVAPDGSIVFADRGNGRIRKIGPDGIITTVAGNGSPRGDRSARVDRLATTVGLGDPTDVAVGPDGTIYIATSYELQSVQPDGVFRILTAPFSTSAQTIDGIPIAQQVVDLKLQSVAIDARGGLLFNDSDWQHRPRPDGLLRDLVRNVDPNGLVTTVSAGVWNTTTFDGAVALQKGPVGASVLTAGPAESVLVFQDQRIYSLERPGTRVVSACNDGAAVYLVPQGDLGHCFDGSGRHLSTLDLRTGQRRFTFFYDNGALSAITPGIGRTTFITRSGGVVSITAPYGQLTTLNPGANGYLASIQDSVAGVTLTHLDNGLLDTYVDRRGTTYRFGYDEFGRLLSDRGAVGTAFDSTQTLTPYAVAGGQGVTLTSPLGRQTLFEVARDTANILTQKVTQPDGTVSTRKQMPDATASLSLADGTEATVVYGPKARFGMRRPMATFTSTKVPSGLTMTSSQSQTATFDDPNNPMTVTSETTTRSLGGGGTWTTVYNKSARTEQTTSPAGRHITRTLDTLGRPSRLEYEGVTPVDFYYDADGRLTQFKWGSRVTRFDYETTGAAVGYLKWVTNALGEVTTFDRDALGRTRYQTRGGYTTGLGWDNNDNLVSVTPSGRPDHILGYSPFDRLISYDPPAIAGLSSVRSLFDQTADRLPWKETRQGTVAVTYNYEPGNNRVDSINRGARLVDYTYYPLGSTANGAAPGRVKTIAGPVGVNVGFKYDGLLLKEMAWSGTIAGSVGWQYNALFQKTEEKVTGSSGTSLVKIGYDADGLMTCASASNCAAPGADAFIITRDPRNGLVTGTAMGALQESFTYDAFGELARQDVKYNGVEISSITYDSATAPRDGLGRVKEMVDTYGASPAKRTTYTYDVRGQLTDVKVDGVEAEHIDYDGNGNRSSYRNPALGTITPTYNDQDRLKTFGPITMVYKANGELSTRADTRIGTGSASFTYDEAGNLLSVQLPASAGGALIEYLVDGEGRRVAKKRNGTIVKRWLYRDGLNPVAELDGAGALVAQFVYGTKPNVPDFVLRGGATYRVISDQLGSPRLVLNVADSGTVFRAAYTAFGEYSGTPTGIDWMPFGFAGGIYDSDTKLLRFGARDYDPATGRWLSRDPILFEGRQANLYTYAGNDPVNRIDPTGKFAPLIAGLIILGDALAGGAANYAMGEHQGSEFIMGAAIGTLTGVATVALGMGVVPAVVGILVVEAILFNALDNSNNGKDLSSGGIAAVLSFGGEQLCDMATGPAGPVACPFAGEALENAVGACSAPADDPNKPKK